MAITYTEYFKSLTSGVEGADITSNSISVVSGDLITVAWIVENNWTPNDVGGTITISNTGTALSWNNIGNTGTQASGDSCYVRVWYAVATASESITITTASNGTPNTPISSQSVVVHTGVHATTPVPAGNIYSGKKSTDVSQSITPTSSGSCLWAVFGDWSATNTFAAIANCTIESSRHDATKYTVCVMRPTTQPRTDASAFTLGETDTNGDISYVIWEVQAAPSASGVSLAWTKG